MVAATIWTVIGTIGLVLLLFLIVMGGAFYVKKNHPDFDPLWFWGTLGLTAWLGSWTWLWIANESDWIFVFEPAAIGGGLGSLTICIFMGVYLASADEKLRSAFAAAFLFFYLGLATDLLVLSEFREVLAGDAQTGKNLSTNPIADDLLTKLGWVLTAVVGFYFANDAVNKTLASKTTREQERTKQEKEKTEQEKERTRQKEAKAPGR